MIGVVGHLLCPTPKMLAISQQKVWFRCWCFGQYLLNSTGQRESRKGHLVPLSMSQNPMVGPLIRWITLRNCKLGDYNTLLPPWFLKHLWLMVIKSAGVVTGHDQWRQEETANDLKMKRCGHVWHTVWQTVWHCEAHDVVRCDTLVTLLVSLVRIRHTCQKVSESISICRDSDIAKMS